MECLCCNNQDVFNRVVRNQLNGEELGLFCKECEQDTFGSLLNDETWHQDHGCAFCDGSGKYQLPKLECLIESENGDAIDIEYTTFEYTVAICESHLAELLPHDAMVEEKTVDRQKRVSVEA
jgi:uncharacterized protein with NAD-binding domain and iron-sulfur cluster